MAGCAGRRGGTQQSADAAAPGATPGGCCGGPGLGMAGHRHPAASSRSPPSPRRSIAPHDPYQGSLGVSRQCPAFTTCPNLGGSFARTGGHAGHARVPARHRPERPRRPEPDHLRRADLADRRRHGRGDRRHGRRGGRPALRLLRRGDRLDHHAHRRRPACVPVHPAGHRDHRGARRRPGQRHHRARDRLVGAVRADRARAGALGASTRSTCWRPGRSAPATR